MVFILSLHIKLKFLLKYWVNIVSSGLRLWRKALDSPWVLEKNPQGHLTVCAVGFQVLNFNSLKHYHTSFTNSPKKYSVLCCCWKTPFNNILNGKISCADFTTLFNIGDIQEYFQFKINNVTQKLIDKSLCKVIEYISTVVYFFRNAFWWSSNWYMMWKEIFKILRENYCSWMSHILDISKKQLKSHFIRFSHTVHANKETKSLDTDADTTFPCSLEFSVK